MPGFRSYPGRGELGTRGNDLRRSCTTPGGGEIHVQDGSQEDSFGRLQRCYDVLEGPHGLQEVRRLGLQVPLLRPQHAVTEAGRPGAFLGDRPAATGQGLRGRLRRVSFVEQRTIPSGSDVKRTCSQQADGTRDTIATRGCNSAVVSCTGVLRGVRTPVSTTGAFESTRLDSSAIATPGTLRCSRLDGVLP